VNVSFGIVLEPPLRIILLRVLVPILLLVAGAALIMLVAMALESLYGKRR
jgi:hypothetical protein